MAWLKNLISGERGLYDFDLRLGPLDAPSDPFSAITVELRRKGKAITSSGQATAQRGLDDGSAAHLAGRSQQWRWLDGEDALLWRSVCKHYKRSGWKERKVQLILKVKSSPAAEWSDFGTPIEINLAKHLPPLPDNPQSATTPPASNTTHLKLLWGQAEGAQISAAQARLSCRQVPEDVSSLDTRAGSFQVPRSPTVLASGEPTEGVPRSPPGAALEPSSASTFSAPLPPTHDVPPPTAPDEPPSHALSIDANSDMLFNTARSGQFDSVRSARNPMQTAQSALDTDTADPADAGRGKEVRSRGGSEDESMPDLEIAYSQASIPLSVASPMAETPGTGSFSAPAAVQTTTAPTEHRRTPTATATPQPLTSIVPVEQLAVPAPPDTPSLATLPPDTAAAAPAATPTGAPPSIVVPVAGFVEAAAAQARTASQRAPTKLDISGGALARSDNAVSAHTGSSDAAAALGPRVSQVAQDLDMPSLTSMPENDPDSDSSGIPTLGDIHLLTSGTPARTGDISLANFATAAAATAPATTAAHKSTDAGSARAPMLGVPAARGVFNAGADADSSGQVQNMFNFSLCLPGAPVDMLGDEVTMARLGDLGDMVLGGDKSHSSDIASVSALAQGAQQPLPDDVAFPVLAPTISAASTLAASSAAPYAADIPARSADWEPEVDLAAAIRSASSLSEQFLVPGAEELLSPAFVGVASSSSLGPASHSRELGGVVLTEPVHSYSRPSSPEINTRDNTLRRLSSRQNSPLRSQGSSDLGEHLLPTDMEAGMVPAVAGWVMPTDSPARASLARNSAGLGRARTRSGVNPAPAAGIAGGAARAGGSVSQVVAGSPRVMAAIPESSSCHLPHTNGQPLDAAALAAQAFGPAAAAAAAAAGTRPATDSQTSMAATTPPPPGVSAAAAGIPAVAAFSAATAAGLAMAPHIGNKGKRSPGTAATSPFAGGGVGGSATTSDGTTVPHAVAAGQQTAADTAGAEVPEAALSADTADDMGDVEEDSRAAAEGLLLHAAQMTALGARSVSQAVDDLLEEQDREAAEEEQLLTGVTTTTTTTASRRGNTGMGGTTRVTSPQPIAPHTRSEATAPGAGVEAEPLSATGRALDTALTAGFGVAMQVAQPEDVPAPAPLTAASTAGSLPGAPGTGSGVVNTAGVDPLLVGEVSGGVLTGPAGAVTEGVGAVPTTALLPAQLTAAKVLVQKAAEVDKAAGKLLEQQQQQAEAEKPRLAGTDTGNPAATAISSHTPTTAAAVATPAMPLNPLAAATATTVASAVAAAGLAVPAAGAAAQPSTQRSSRAGVLHRTGSGVNSGKVGDVVESELEQGNVNPAVLGTALPPDTTTAAPGSTAALLTDTTARNTISGHVDSTTGGVRNRIVGECVGASSSRGSADAGGPLGAGALATGELPDAEVAVKLGSLLAPKSATAQAVNGADTDTVPSIAQVHEQFASAPGARDIRFSAGVGGVPGGMPVVAVPAALGQAVGGGAERGVGTVRSKHGGSGVATVQKLLDLSSLHTGASRSYLGEVEALEAGPHLTPLSMQKSRGEAGAVAQPGGLAEVGAVADRAAEQAALLGAMAALEAVQSVRPTYKALPATAAAKESSVGQFGGTEGTVTGTEELGVLPWGGSTLLSTQQQLAEGMESGVTRPAASPASAPGPSLGAYAGGGRRASPVARPQGRVNSVISGAAGFVSDALAAAAAKVHQDMSKVGPGESKVPVLGGRINLHAKSSLLGAAAWLVLLVLEAFHVAVGFVIELPVLKGLVAVGALMLVVPVALFQAVLGWMPRAEPHM